MEKAMRIYQVLVIGSFVALAACSGESTETASDSGAPPSEALPANDLGNTYPSQTGETASTTPGAEGGRSSATTGETGAYDANGRPAGAVDPIRTPAPSP
jgi:hypothetical protein